MSCSPINRGNQLDLTIMLLLLLLPTVQAIVSVVIKDEGFSLFLSNQNGKYIVYTIEGKNNSYYAYPFESVTDFSYDGNYTINNHIVNRLWYNGIVTPPAWLQKWFRKPINTCKTLQVCYDFSTERLSLKIVLGLLALVFVASHGTKIGTAVKTLGTDILQSKIARGVPRAGSPVAGSQATYTPVEKEARAWFSESPETLYKTSTISRSEEVSQSVC